MSRTVTRSIARIATVAALATTALVGVTSTGASAAPKDCAYNPGGRGGYGTYVDKIAVDQMDWEISLFNAVNTYRVQNHLPKLAFSRTLARPAMWASLDSYARGFSPSNHIDSRGMNVPTRVQYCSGYTGYLGEINYYGIGIQPAKWQSALAWWKQSPGHNARMLDPGSTVMAVGLAYEGEDRHRAHYTIVFGNH
jgi:uncharacterized protein YkwD